MPMGFPFKSEIDWHFDSFPVITALDRSQDEMEVRAVTSLY